MQRGSTCWVLFFCTCSDSRERTDRTTSRSLTENARFWSKFKKINKNKSIGNPIARPIGLGLGPYEVWTLRLHCCLYVFFFFFFFGGLLNFSMVENTRLEHNQGERISDENECSDFFIFFNASETFMKMCTVVFPFFPLVNRIPMTYLLSLHNFVCNCCNK